MCAPAGAPPEVVKHVWQHPYERVRGTHPDAPTPRRAVRPSRSRHSVLGRAVPSRHSFLDGGGRRQRRVWGRSGRDRRVQPARDPPARDPPSRGDTVSRPSQPFPDPDGRSRQVLRYGPARLFVVAVSLGDRPLGREQASGVLGSGSHYVWAVVIAGLPWDQSLPNIGPSSD